MRITYRNHSGTKDYWASRWTSIPADVAMRNVNVYPLMQSLQTILKNDGPILEVGCGSGRILRYFHDNGYDIKGIDYIEVAIEKLRKADPKLKVEVGDITALRFSDASFRYLLAFGLYHNLEHGMDEDIRETWRVLEKGGRLCASFRADNLQTRLTDWLSAHKTQKGRHESDKSFHKLNLTRREVCRYFESIGFVIEKIEPVENMPIFYKFPLFRAKGHKDFDEHKARTKGYQLSRIGQLLQKLCMTFLPNQFCNIYFLIACKL